MLLYCNLQSLKKLPSVLACVCVVLATAATSNQAYTQTLTQFQWQSPLNFNLLFADYLRLLLDELTIPWLPLPEQSALKFAAFCAKLTRSLVQYNDCACLTAESILVEPMPAIEAPLAIANAYSHTHKQSFLPRKRHSKQSCQNYLHE